MKVYAQFFHNSTGYVPGSVPPQFSKDNIKPIELLGSDGVMILDGRNKLSTLVVKATKRQLKNKATGFKIVKSDRFSNNGNVVYSTF